VQPFNWYRESLRNYAIFEGRSRRREYWTFVICNSIAIAALTVVDRVIGTWHAHAQVGLLSGVFALAMIVPSIAVGVRRLHDTGRRGWWFLVVLVPLVGWITMIVFACQDSQPGANRYGPNPKGVLGPGTPSPIVRRDLSR
jgi:uncharacterized membrane protein YhaH (DUF805 family)